MMMSKEFLKHEIRSFLNDDGKIHIWPSKEKKKAKVMTYIASCFEKDIKYSEKEVNEIIKNEISFEDYVIIRRELYNRNFLDRSDDGREYWVM